jgi:hypothetical protein
MIISSRFQQRKAKNHSASGALHKVNKTHSVYSVHTAVGKLELFRLAYGLCSKLRYTTLFYVSLLRHTNIIFCVHFVAGLEYTVLYITVLTFIENFTLKTC